MKNYILILAFLFCATSATIDDDNHFEGTQLSLTIYKDNNLGNTEHPRTPVRTPVVYQNDHTLYFYSECENSVIDIKDENGQCVYRATITDVPESLIIPECLSGDYEIRFYINSYYYSGIIEL